MVSQSEKSRKSNSKIVQKYGSDRIKVANINGDISARIRETNINSIWSEAAFDEEWRSTRATFGEGGGLPRNIIGHGLPVNCKQ